MLNCMELLMNDVRNHLVIEKEGKITSIALSEVAGKIRKIGEDHPLVEAAKGVKVSFGV